MREFILKTPNIIGEFYRKDEHVPDTEETQRKYFAVAFLFSNAQVEPIPNHEQKKAA